MREAEGKHIFIKNMVCRRCIMMVTDLFKRHGLEPLDVRLGVVGLSHPPTPKQKETLRQDLQAYGFEVIDDRRMCLLEQIRVGIIEYVREPDLQGKVNLSGYLQDKCRKEYSALSKLFSEVKGIHIEQYYLEQKIELVKELLVYDELTVSEIAHRLHYSSVAHLSAQFKARTGMSPTSFRQIKNHALRPIDEI